MYEQKKHLISPQGGNNCYKHRQSHSSYVTSSVPSYHLQYVCNRKEPQGQRWLHSISAPTAVLGVRRSGFRNQASPCKLQLNKADTEIYFRVDLKCSTRRFFSAVASSLRIKLISLQYNEEFRNFRFLITIRLLPNVAILHLLCLLSASVERPLNLM